MEYFGFSAFHLLLVVLVGLMVTLQADATSSSVHVNGVAYRVRSSLTRDVCIIGGGSSGTYAAIRLSDLGETVLLIEQKGRLGGHTETYTDPITGLRYDMGVEVWHDLPIVKDYFSRLNVSLVKRTEGPISTQYFDFQTGNVQPSNIPADLNAGLAAYGVQLAKYPYLEQGFDLPSPIPSDLLLPFGKFVQKYSLQSVAGFLYTFAQGLGDHLSQPTLYVFKNFGLDILRNLRVGFLTTENHNNNLLYDRAAAVLDHNVLLNSKVIAVDRSTDPQQPSVLVSSPSGLTIIQCRKLIMAIPPKLDNLVGWDLSLSELSLFAQFSNAGYYTGVLRNAGVPDHTLIINVSPDTIYNHPILPGIYKLIQTGIPNTIGVVFGSLRAIPDEDVQKQILSDVQRLKVPGKGDTKPEFVAYSRHTPFELTVSTAAIAGGFYKALYSLQGQSRTWYTGAAFHTQDSSLLWQFTEALLTNITAS